MAWKRWAQVGLSGFLLSTASIVSAVNCPIGGSEFPKPRNLAGNSIWQAAMRNLTAFFEDFDVNGLASTPGTRPANYSYSIRMFSSNPGTDVLWERYHTAENLPSWTPGVKKVDADTVFRLGSITKVFTVLAILAEDGFAHFNDPVTKWVPELAELKARQESNPDAIMHVDWEDITLEALTSQMAGIVRDYGVLGELTQTVTPWTLWPYMGMPILPASDYAACGVYPICDRRQFFEGLSKIPPSTAPWTTPLYSDAAFQLLAYSIESITGKPFKQILTDRVISPLNLTRSFLDRANETYGIIPGTVNSTLWYGQLGDLNPSGNMYSSARDLAKLGIAIMNSTLLRPAMTRRWLKPVSYTPDILAAIGMPFGLRRMQIDERAPHRTITSFNKAGSTRWWSGMISLIPDWNIGFSVLLAGDISTVNTFGVADFLAAIIVPAFDLAVRNEADKIYSGTYVAEEEGLNSTLTISTDPSKPGLGIAPWISNGTDMIPLGYMMQMGTATPAVAPAARLYWMGLEQAAQDGSRRQSFKSVFEEEAYPPLAKPNKYVSDCVSWMGQTGITYAAQALDHFVFNLDADGKVVSVENLALRVKLRKVR